MPKPQPVGPEPAHRGQCALCSFPFLVRSERAALETLSDHSVKLHPELSAAGTVVIQLRPAPGE